MIEGAHVPATLWGFTVVIEPDADEGGYVVHCPALQGCWSQDETIVRPWATLLTPSVGGLRSTSNDLLTCHG